MLMKTNIQRRSYHSTRRRDHLDARKEKRFFPLRRWRPMTTAKRSRKPNGFAVATEKLFALHPNVHTILTCSSHHLSVQANGNSSCTSYLLDHVGDPMSLHGSESKTFTTTPSSRMTFVPSPPPTGCTSSGMSCRVTNQTLPCVDYLRSKGSFTEYFSGCMSCGKPCHANNTHPSCPYFQRPRGTLDE